MKGSSHRSFLAALAIGATAGVPIGPAYAIDTEIYLANRTLSEQVRPNVLFVFDTSGSMGLIDSGETTTRMARLQSAFGTILDNVTNLNIGIARYTIPGGPILFPVSYIDDDATAIETSGQADFNARIVDGNDDGEELASSGATHEVQTRQ